LPAIRGTATPIRDRRERESHMADNDQTQIRPGLVRTRRRRARLKEAGVLTFTCELWPPIGDALCKAAAIANMHPSHLIETIVAKHFERALAGQRRQASQHKADDEAGHEVAG
jgi:hypothetical protein